MEEKAIELFVERVLANSITAGLLLLICWRYVVNLKKEYDTKHELSEDKLNALIEGLRACKPLNGEFKTAYDDALAKVYRERDRKNKHKK